MAGGLLFALRSVLKRRVFGAGPRRTRVLSGAGRGLWLTIDHAHNVQRRLGLAEREIEGDFARLARRSRSLADIGASDGWYGLLARRCQPGIAVRAWEPRGQLSAAALGDWTANGFPTEALDWRAEPAHDLAAALAGIAGPVLVKVDIDGGEGALLADPAGVERLRSLDGALIVETHSAALEAACLEALAEADYSCRVVPQARWRRWLPEHRSDIRHNRWLVAERP